MSTDLALHIKIAHTTGEVRACKALIAENWKRNYDVDFSEEDFNLEKRVEKFADRFLMGTVDGELVITGGLYLYSNYVERFGLVTRAEIERELAGLELADQFQASDAREYTKLAVKSGWEKRGIGRVFHCAIFNRNFVSQESDREHFLLLCAKLSIFENLYFPQNLRPHYIKPFPEYAIHNLYRAKGEVIQSRLLIPSRDVPKYWYDLEYDRTYALSELKSHLSDLREDQMTLQPPALAS
jgi:hypothetical protein